MVTPLNVTREQSGIINDIAQERKQQDRKWGGPAHDDQHDRYDWLGFLHRKVREAGSSARLIEQAEAQTIDPSAARSAGTTEYRRVLVQIAALALAAVEAHDRAEARFRFDAIERDKAPKDPPAPTPDPESTHVEEGIDVDADPANGDAK